MSLHSASARATRALASFLVFALLLLVWPGSASAAHQSLLCPVQTGTVAQGGSVTLDVSDCSEDPGFAGEGGMNTPAQNGTATLRVSGNQWLLDYTHNGGPSTSDVFEFADDDNRLVEVRMTITPAASAIAVSPATLALTVGVAVDTQLTASGGIAPYTFAVSAGSLPPGLSMADGRITGTPTQRGSYNFTVTATDGATPSDSGTRSYAGTTQDPSLAVTPTTINVAQNQPLSAQIVATGGISPYEFSLESGTLPSGLSLSSTGLISGTTNVAAASYAIDVRVTDSSTGVGRYHEVKQLTLVVAALPTVSIAVSPNSVTENSGTGMVYTVTRSTVSAAPLTVNLAYSGTATSGVDYDGEVSTVQIAANQASASFTITPRSDTDLEADETVIVSVSNGSGYAVGSPASATGTIVNSPLPALSVGNVSQNEGNTGQSAFNFQVTLDAPAGPGGVSFTLATSDGTAIAGQDYVARTVNATIPQGGTSYTFAVQVIGNTLFEADKTFVVTASTVVGATVANAQGTGTILNDDVTPSLSINSVSQFEGNSGTTPFTFTVTLSAASGLATQVNYATADDIATAGTDYQAVSGTLTFAPGVTTQTITVPVIGNLTHQPNRTFTVDLSGASNATIASASGTAIIIDDDAALQITTLTLPNPQVGAPYSQTVEATGGSGPLTYMVVTGALPSGLSLAASGTISGTPVAAGSFTFSVRAADLNGNSDEVAYTYNVPAPTLSVAPKGTQTIGRGVAATIDYGPASGGFGSYSWQIISGAVPSGMTLNLATGQVSGVPVVLGTYNFSIRVSDSTTGTAGPARLTIPAQIIVVEPVPVAGPVTLPLAYNAPATAVPLVLSGGIATAIQIQTPPSHGTALVSGLSVTYVPLTGFRGTDSFVYTASNANGTSTPATVTVNVAAPVLIATPSDGLTAVAGQPYTQTFTWSGGHAPYGDHQVSNLPAGVTVTATTANSVTISGIPTMAGSFAMQVSAKDSSTGEGPIIGSQPFNLVVSGPTLTLSPAASALPPTTVGVAWQQTFAAAAGIAPYSYSVTGTVPPGLSLNTATGLLSGTPTAGGSYSFTIIATDSTGGTASTISQSYTLQVAAPVTVLPVSGTVFTATAGTAFQQQLNVTGGIAPYQYSVSGALPDGVTLDAGTGLLSGTPTASGSFVFSITARDSTAPAAASATANYTLQVDAPTLSLTPATVVAGTAGSSYQQPFTASGGIAPYQYSVSGALPDGLTLDAGTGVLSGTPTASGSFAFSITATDSTAGTAASVVGNYTLQVAAPTLSLSPATLVAGTAGSSYQQPFTASGGIAPYQYSVSGALPAGLTLDAGSGLLSGTPTASGSFAFSVTATDSTGGTAASTVGNYTLQIATPTLVLSPGTLAVATAGQAFEHVFAVSGGIAPYQYNVTGALPAGLTLDAARGVLSGTPTESGRFDFTVSVVDSTAGTAATASQAVSLTVNAPTLTPTDDTVAVPPATAGGRYEAVFRVTGGIAPYRYSVTGTLPAGLTLDTSTGVLSGTPTDAGSFTFTVTVTDSTGGTPATASFVQTLQIAAPLLSMTPAAGALPGVLAATAYEQTFSSSGGIAPYRYAVIEGTLPAGLVLDAATGRLAGSTTVAGEARFSITVTDSTGGTAATLTQAYTLSVAAPSLTLTPDTLPAGIFGRDYQAQMSTTGGTAPYRYQVSAGALPTGLQLEQGGRLSGIPTAGGSFSLTITATDANGFTGQREYVLQIALRPDPTRDAEVRGLLDAQADTARRFARSQIENFQQRMQRLHGAARNGGFSNNLSLSPTSQANCDRGPGAKTAPECDRQRRSPFDAEREPDATAAAGNSAQQDRALGLWIGGNIRSGRNSSGRGAGTDFESDGLTVGTDYRLNDAFVLGAGVGYGKDRSDVGQLGSRSDGQAYTLAVYGSYSPGQRLFVDMLLGHQLLDYTLRRHVTADGSFVHGRRDGQQWFGSLAVGADFGNGPWQLTPYARLDASHGQLDAYGEQGNSLFGLVYGNQDVRATTGNAGLRMAWQNTRPWGGWRPNLQVEYQHDFNGNGSATLQYADMLDVPFYRTTLDGFERNRWMLGAGVQFDFRRHWGLRVDYRGLVGSDDRDHGVQISLDKQL